MTNRKKAKNDFNTMLKSFTKKKLGFGIQKPGNGSLKTTNGYFESIEYFYRRFLIERRRSERGDYEFSIIVIDLDSFENKRLPNRNEKQFLKAEETLFSTVKLILRETDAVVKYFPLKLAILLPDTASDGSQIVMNRIKEILNNLGDRSLQAIFQNVMFYPYSYPSQEFEINKFINDRIFDNSSSTIELEKKVRDVKSSYFYCNGSNGFDKKDYFRMNSNGSIAFANPFCVLNEALSDLTKNWQVLLKRCLDVVLSSIGIIIASPIILLICILIKLTSKGPIFFKQERIGYMGKKFLMYKFRTMYQLRDDQVHRNYITNYITNTNQRNEGPRNTIFKLKNDPRITPIGKYLRRLSVDEITQLFNVLKGDMSLVGPRPPLQYEVDIYDLWHKRRYLTVKPGITGLWQIYGRSSTTFNEMVRLDLAYVKHWSIWLDLHILFRTVGSVLRMKGAY
ncbi:MAG: sugar transferase [bacterium]|nr:sugar transferase [bacterium]